MFICASSSAEVRVPRVCDLQTHNFGINTSNERPLAQKTYAHFVHVLTPPTSTKRARAQCTSFYSLSREVITIMRTRRSAREQDGVARAVSILLLTDIWPHKIGHTFRRTARVKERRGELSRARAI